jgi:L-ascorbate metabolism protein UlaG (beta-lactamase superfamily)
MTAGLRRRTLLSRTAIVAAGSLAGAWLPACGSPDVEPIRRWSGPPGSSGVFLRWFGNNAWEIHFGTTTILIDPWFTRYSAGAYEAGGLQPATPLAATDPAKVDPYIRRVTLILVCEGHYDNIADVPYIAAKTGARVVGTRSHCNTLRAMGVPDAQLTAVQGGQRLTHDKYEVAAFASLHATTGSPPQVPVPGSRDTVPAPPHTVADLVEGGTLAYQVTVRNQFRILLLSTANFVEAALAGQRPDLAIVPAIQQVPAGQQAAGDFAGPLLRTLDYPTWVLPTGWDNVDRPITDPAVDRGGLVALREAVATASPGTSFIKLDHLQVFSP